jgi:hypothetical protein
LAQLGFKQGYDKADWWQQKLLEKCQRMFGILSRGMQVAKNGKCNNLQQNESIWEERIELITHIFLSSQVNLAWTRIKNSTTN